MVTGQDEKKRLRELQRENMALKAENAKLLALLEYVAMMTDVDIEEDEEDAAQ